MNEEKFICETCKNADICKFKESAEKYNMKIKETYANCSSYQCMKILHISFVCEKYISENSSIVTKR